MYIFPSIIIVICLSLDSLQDSIDLENNNSHSFDIGQLKNVFKEYNIDRSLHSCATQCISGCSTCESECEYNCEASGDSNENEGNIIPSPNSPLSKSKIFKFFFGNDENDASNHTMKYWRNRVYSMDTSEGDIDCSSTIASACVTSCQAICQVCEFECGIQCDPDDSYNTGLFKYVKNFLRAKLDRSEMTSVCESSCDAMCESTLCECKTKCEGSNQHDDCINLLGPFQNCEQSNQMCQTHCLPSCLDSIPSNLIGESVNENEGAPISIGDNIMGGSINENDGASASIGDNWTGESINESNGAVISTDESAGEDPFSNLFAPGCEKCSEAVSECESSCALDNLEAIAENDINRKFIDPLTSWYSKKYRFFEPFVQTISGRSSPSNLTTKEVALSESCKATVESGCISACQASGSTCQVQCEAVNNFFGPHKQEDGSFNFQDLQESEECPNFSNMMEESYEQMCEDICGAYCPGCSCQCEGLCNSNMIQKEGLIIEISSCEDCESTCRTCEIDCKANCLSQTSRNGLIEMLGCTSENSGEDITIDNSVDGSSSSNSINSGSGNPEPESPCQSICSSCVPECESTCASGSLLDFGSNGINKNNIISVASWYSSRLKIFELLMEKPPGRSSRYMYQHDNVARTDNCGMVMASACQTACQSTCSLCEAQCEASNQLNEENIDSNDPSMDESFDSSSQSLAVMETEMNEMCGDVCNALCSTCECLCESACIQTLGGENESSFIDSNLLDDQSSRCTMLCQDSCSSCKSECEDPCRPQPNTELSQPNDTPPSPPVGTKLSFDMHTRLAGEGLSVTIYFVVVEDGMKMYCDTTALPDTTAAQIWSDIDSLNSLEDIESEANSVDANTDQDANIVTNGENFISEGEGIFDRSNTRDKQCPENTPHIYILKDTSCCGLPRLPQCAAVNGIKLGCIDKLGRYPKNE